MRTLIFILMLGLSATLNAQELKTIGWIESITLLPQKLTLEAKIDTGADNSSVDVTHWESFTRENKEWIRYQVRVEDGKTLEFEGPIMRYALIKRKGAEPLRRPVIEMSLCIGEQEYLAPVNLADRGNFKYRMLIGRSLLKGNFLVDSSAKHTTKPACK